MTEIMQYSDALMIYLGRVELNASNETDDVNRYNCFVTALLQLDTSDLSREDVGLARKVLSQKVRDEPKKGEKVMTKEAPIYGGASNYGPFAALPGS
ncbi:hypothetical protein HYT23_06055 [Candidatus Pacearchaeota archaeon]|nr:hypothetical protein [Candidatus Pacearchaeota archaeon]